METPIATKIADLPKEFVVDLPAGADQAAIDSLVSSLRSQIVYNSRFEEEATAEDSVHVTIVSRDADRVKVRVEA